MNHPLAQIEPTLLGSLTIRFGALLLFSTALMMFVNVPLQGDASPNGIVSFELAGTPYQALRILLEWKIRDALGYARLSLIVDFIYLLIYALFFSSLALWVGKRLVTGSGALARLGQPRSRRCSTSSKTASCSMSSTVSRLHRPTRRSPRPSL